ncbi:MAG: S-layer homology domain-containing protein [Clostridia bacterium]|nr:S-layer homology domain-containing protein [Clostridia bacterium]
MKTNRIISFILAIMMVASMILVGTTVSAEEVSPYTDVKVKRWSFADIMYVTENGLMNGTGEGIFAPAETMTRAMVVTVLYRLQGEPEVDYSTKSKDVKEGKWFTNAVIWAAEKEIVNGVGDNKFAPMETITREQLATIIMRYAPTEYIITNETKDITGYADYKRVHEYAREALSWANAIGLITGVTEDTLAPREGATREQFAAILRRFKEYDKFEYMLAYTAPKGFSTYTEKEYPLVTDADVYVAVDGNDANPGTLDKPVKTFAKAKELVRELKKTATDEIKVAFKAGNYGSLDNLQFTAEDSGTEAVPITYCAYGDGDVIFSNGHLISESEFKALDDAEKALFDEEARDFIKKVDLNGEFDELKNNNVLFSSTGVCWEARFPNKKSDGIDMFYSDFTTRVEEEGKEEWQYDKLQLQSLVRSIANKFTTYDGLKITGMFRTGWLHDTFATKAYDRETGILTLDFENSGFENGYSIKDFCLAFEDRMDDTIFFHNLAELMDAKGEYWFDKNTKQLYVYAPEGDYAISRSGTFMTLSEDADYISFVGLEFNCSTANAIESHGDHITYKLCTFGNVAGDAVIHAEKVNNFLASECEFYNFVSVGIDLRSDANKQTLESANNVIDNNYFHDFTLPQYFDGSAIIITKDIKAKISHNYFKNGGHSAIRFNENIESEFEYNIFDNMMMTTADFGAVYTWHAEAWRGNKIRYNLFMNFVDGAKYGIYLDDGTAGQEVYGNIFYNVKGQNIVFNGGRDNVVHDNVFIESAWFTWNAGLYGLIQDGTPEEIVNHANYTYLMGAMVKEGEEGYELWKEKWPIMYAYHTDASKVGEVECLYTTVHYLTNNYSFGNLGITVDENGEASFGEMGRLFGQFCKNNRSYDTDVNPIFVDPTHGDYSIREDVDFLDNHFKEMGRY